MPTRAVTPDALLEQIGLAGTAQDIAEDPGAPDAAWLSYNGAVNGNTELRVALATPPGSPRPGGGLQQFLTRVRKNASGGNATSWALELWENDVQRAELATGTTATVVGEVVSGTWDAALLTNPDGSGVECRLVQTSGGDSGNPGNRRRLEIGAVRWIVDYLIDQDTAVEAWLQDHLTTNGSQFGGDVCTAMRDMGHPGHWCARRLFALVALGVLTLNGTTVAVA